MARGFISTMNRIARDAERNARARQRAVEKNHRDQLRAERAYQRALIADEKEQKRLYVEAQMAEAEAQNEEIEERIQELTQVLAVGLKSAPFNVIAELRDQAAIEVAPLDLSDIAAAEAAPLWKNHEPTKPGFLTSLIPWFKNAYEEDLRSAQKEFQRLEQAHKTKDAARQEQIAQRIKEHELSVEKARRAATELEEDISTFEAALSKNVPEAVVHYFDTVLTSSPFPDGFPCVVQMEYQAESKQLIVAYDLPEYEEVIPRIKSVKYVKASDTFTESARPESQRRAMYTEVVAQTTLRCIHEVFKSDSAGRVETIVFNGYVQAIDKGTGKSVHPCLVTVRTTRDAFNHIELARVEPAICLKALNASVSKSAAELVPVRPVLELNMSDPRFIQESDVLSTLDQRPNLMDLTPGEFESLITNLFQAMGLETRQTQASRDGGVDCVAFDPRPIFGGKVVIQAKRYKNTVGVSAVRDLFGTMQNEGASKGILVATSGYGKAAFDFANGKPIELLAGSNLLYLLKEHADLDAKIVMPDDWKDIGPDQ